jgi:putative salt-induced outer membrane protein
VNKAVLIILATPMLLANAATAAAAKKDAPIPEQLKMMLDAAMASGNEGDVATLVKYSRIAAPDSIDLVREITNKWTDDRAARRTRELQESSFFALVKGRAELGGYMSSGNSDNFGATGVLDLSREGFRWRHKLRLQLDYQKANNVTSREYYLAAYEPNYKVDDRLYIYGSTQYESDRFVGYYNRYSASAGAGYSAIKRPRITLDVELGPAFRHTNFTDETLESNLAARGSIDFDWRLSRSLTLRQDASAYIVAKANSTASSTTALDAKLLGPLSAQFSYAVRYESNPPEGSVTTDTTTRASLVYSF